MDNTPQVTPPPAPDQPPIVTTVRVSHMAYVWAHHRVGFVASMVAALILWLSGLSSGLIGAIIVSLIFYPIIVFSIWYMIAASELEQALFRSYATKRGYNFIPKPQQFSLNLPIERLGHGHRTFDLVSGAYPGVTQFLLYLHSLSIGYGRDQKTYTYCVTSLTLPESGPHLYLNRQPQAALAVFTDSYITSTFQAAKRYSLEGDFDKSYHLFGEQHDEINLLELINPATMQKLIDLPGYDIELSGNVLSFYRLGKPLSLDEIDRVQAVGAALLAALAPTMQHMDLAVAKGIATPESTNSSTPTLK